MAEELDPSAGTVDGTAVIVDVEAEAIGDWNTTVAVGVSATLSVTSMALKITFSDAKASTENVALPFPSVTEEPGEMLTVVEGNPDSETAFPVTGLPPEVWSVTVTEVPKFTSAGDAVANTVESPGDTDSVPNVTEAVWVRLTLSDVSLAVYVTRSFDESTALNVATPELSVVDEAGVTTELPPDGVRETAFPGTACPIPDP